MAKVERQIGTYIGAGTGNPFDRPTSCTMNLFNASLLTVSSRTAGRCNRFLFGGTSRSSWILRKRRLEARRTTDSVASCGHVTFRPMELRIFSSVASGRWSADREGRVLAEDTEEEGKLEGRFLEDEETEFQRLVEEENYHLVPGAGKNVLILQPKINWGKNKPKNTTPELMAVEARALVETLPGMQT